MPILRVQVFLFARETEHVGLVVEYASVASLWRNTKRRTPVAVAGRSVG
jgi:hypothetical protein